LGDLDTGLRVKEKTVKYRNGFLEKSCKDLQTTKSKKLSKQRKNGGNTNNFVKNGKTIC
jgi:hypothetical protein